MVKSKTLTEEVYAYKLIQFMRYQNILTNTNVFSFFIVKQQKMRLLVRIFVNT